MNLWDALCIHACYHHWNPMQAHPRYQVQRRFQVGGIWSSWEEVRWHTFDWVTSVDGWMIDGDSEVISGVFQNIQYRIRVQTLQNAVGPYDRHNFRNLSLVMRRIDR